MPSCSITSKLPIMVMRAYAFLLLVATWVGRATQSPACSWLHSSKVNTLRKLTYSAINSALYRLTARTQSLAARSLSAHSPAQSTALPIGLQPGHMSLAARSLPAYSPGAVPCGSLSTGLQPGRSPLRLALYRLTARAQSLAARSLPAYSPGAVPCGSLSTGLQPGSCALRLALYHALRVRPFRGPTPAHNRVAVSHGSLLTAYVYLTYALDAHTMCASITSHTQHTLVTSEPAHTCCVVLSQCSAHPALVLFSHLFVAASMRSILMLTAHRAINPILWSLGLLGLLGLLGVLGLSRLLEFSGLLGLLDLLGLLGLFRSLHSCV
jgi:hypothetical protein